MEILIWVLVLALFIIIFIFGFFSFERQRLRKVLDDLKSQVNEIDEFDFGGSEYLADEEDFEDNARTTSPRKMHEPLDSEHYAEDYLERIPEALSSAEPAFNGKGMTYHRNNWVGLYKKLGRPSNREVELFAVLAPERDNRYDATAVSIAVHGRVIARVPAEISSKLTTFIDQHGGLVKVIVVLWFDPSRERSTVRVHLAQPMRMKEDFQTDLRVVRRIGKKWENELIGFVD